MLDKCETEIVRRARHEQLQHLATMYFQSTNLEERRIILELSRELTEGGWICDAAHLLRHARKNAFIYAHLTNWIVEQERMLQKRQQEDNE